MKKKNKVLTKEYYNIHNFLCYIGFGGLAILFLFICFMKIKYNSRLPVSVAFFIIIFSLIFIYRKLGLDERFKIYQAIQELKNHNEIASGDSEQSGDLSKN